MIQIIRTAAACPSYGWRLAVAAVLLAVVAGPMASPAAAATPTLEATYTNIANGWVKVERYLDTRAGFTQEDYPPDGRGDQDGQRLTFFGGVREPFSGRFLLYYAP